MDLSYKLRGIDIKLNGYIKSQQEDGYWRNGVRLDIETPDIYTTTLNALNLLKLSPSRQWRQSGIKAAEWIKTKQNSDGSWSFQFLNNGKIASESDIFTTLLCLEVLKRSKIDNIEEIIKKGENWTINQQNTDGMWDDGDLPFPFLTVLILEYFYNKEIISHQLPLFLHELTPESIIYLGMKRAIEISKLCKSEDNRITPKVGAVIIKNDQIVLEAYRGETAPGDHAEYIVLEKKGKDYDLKDAILITTLEPCTTRRPNRIPCAKRIINTRIKKIWVGILDPNPQITGKGILYTTNHGVSVGYINKHIS